MSNSYNSSNSSGGFMEPISAGIIGLGGLLSNVIGAGAQDEANAANAAEGRANRTQQLYMSNTAHVRAMEDMKTAGLNPAMMFGSGGPASTASGSSLSAQAFKPDSSFLSDMVNTAADVEQKKKQNEKIQSDTDLNRDVQDVQKANAYNLKQQGRTNSAIADMSEQEAKFYKDNPWARTVKELGGVAGTAFGAAGALKKLFEVDRKNVNDDLINKLTPAERKVLRRMR